MNTRREKRTPVTLKIKFKSATLDQFIERYSVDVSHGGIFIRTKDPLAVGTQLRFEFQLQDASPLISGDGTVVWIREFDPSRVGVAPGMGVRFDRLVAESEPVLQKILAQKNKDHTDQKFDGPASQKPPENTRVAPLSQVQGLAAKTVPPAREQPPLRPPPTTGVNPPAARSQTQPPVRAQTQPPVPRVGSLAPPRSSFPEEQSRDQTPLPKPMPFHAAGDDDFSDDVFDQPTKVASLDSLLAAQNAGLEEDDDDAKTVNKPIPTRPEPTPAPPMAASQPGDRPHAAKTMLGMGPVPMPPSGVKPMPPQPVAAPPRASGAIPKTEPPAPRPSQSMKVEPAVMNTPSAADVPARPGPTPGSGARQMPVAHGANHNDKSRFPDASPTPAPLPRSPSGPVPMQVGLEQEKPWTANWPEPVPQKVPGGSSKQKKGSSVGLIVGGLLFAGVAAAAGWWFFLREEDTGYSGRGVASAPPGRTTAPAPVADAPKPAGDKAPPPATPPEKPADEPKPAAVPAPPAGDGTVEVEITSVPKGAILVVDGKEVGPTPQKLTGLDPEKKLALAARLACYREATVQVPPKGPIEIRLAPSERSLRVTSDPVGAAIWVDGKPTGLKTPADVKLIGRLDPKVAHKVTFKKAGKKDAEVDVAPDAPCTMEGALATIPVKATLEPAVAAAVEPAAPRPRPRPRPPEPPPGGEVTPPDPPPQPPAGGEVKPPDPAPVEAPKPEEPKPAETPKPPPPEAPKEPPKEPVAPPPTEAPKPPEAKPEDKPKPPTQDGCDPSPDAPDWAKCK
jgi:uncharacterized protein (TIGR02266 family)